MTSVLPFELTQSGAGQLGLQESEQRFRAAKGFTAARRDPICRTHHFRLKSQSLLAFDVVVQAFQPQAVIGAPIPEMHLGVGGVMGTVVLFMSELGLQD